MLSLLLKCLKLKILYVNGERALLGMVAWLVMLALKTDFLVYIDLFLLILYQKRGDFYF